MKLKARAMVSVACIRHEAPPGSGKWKGCGKGWVRPAGQSYTCADCMGRLIVTGRFAEAELKSRESEHGPIVHRPVPSYAAAGLPKLACDACGDWWPCEMAASNEGVVTLERPSPIRKEPADG